MTGDSSPAITLEELTSGAVPSEVMRLYESAFPAHERLPIKDMLSWGKGYRLLDGGHFCGLAFVSVCGELVWLLFFAIVEELRSQGVGTRALAAISDTVSSLTSSQRIPRRRISPSGAVALPSGDAMAFRMRSWGFGGAANNMRSRSKAVLSPSTRCASSGNGEP